MDLLGQTALFTRNQLRDIHRPPTGPGQQPGLTASQEGLFREIGNRNPPGHLLLYHEVRSQGCQCWSDGKLWDLRDARVPIAPTSPAHHCKGFWLTPNPFHGQLERILSDGNWVESRRAKAC